MNRIWTSDDFRVLRAALRGGGIEDAAKRLNRSRSEVEEMARDLGWVA